MGWLIVFAFRADTWFLGQGIAQWRKKPAMGAATAGISNGGWAYWHGGSLTAVALLNLCQKVVQTLPPSEGRTDARQTGLGVRQRNLGRMRGLSAPLGNE